MELDRRTFLKWASAVGALVSGALVGIPALRAFASPLFRRKTEETWVELGEVDLFDIGIPVRIDFVQTVNDAWLEGRVLRGVWLYTEDGENFAVYNGRCTHLGCSYSFHEESDSFHLEQGVFHCPCHHAMFDLSGGVIRGPAPRPLDTLEVKIEDGILYAKYQDFRAGISEKIPL